MVSIMEQKRIKWLGGDAPNGQMLGVFWDLKWGIHPMRMQVNVFHEFMKFSMDNVKDPSELKPPRWIFKYMFLREPFIVPHLLRAKVYGYFIT